ncbi:hypothetical protein HWV62_32162 [Athelia sp. TMB]|nr:hypothetical protein HWV62_32162 [Athelia sp. TMB]
MNRERAQERHQLPGKGGPLVFIWEEVNGWLIRTKLNRKQVDDEWENYTDAQRKFDSINNEWDLAVEFAPQEEPPNDFDDQYDAYLHPMDISPVCGPSELPPQSSSELHSRNAASPVLETPLPPANYEAVLAKVYDLPAPITLLRGLEPLDLVVYNRYGFVWRDLPYNPDTILKRPRSAPDWNSTRRTLCDVVSHWCATSLQDPLSDFVDCFVKDRDLPISFWDGCAENGRYILGTGQNSKNNLRLLSYEGKMLYLISDDSSAVNYHQKPAYEVLVEDPLTALECLRRKQLVNRREIVKHLITTGKAFMTRSRTSQLPYPQADIVKWNRPPGYRRPAWKPDMLDYKHYENHRNDFLLTPHARAAVKYGGIVWRLSVQSIDPDYVTAGPSSEVLATTRAKYFDHDDA